MKKGLALLVASVMIFSSFPMPTTVYASSKNRVTRECVVMEGETMYSDRSDVAGLETVSNYKKGIMYVLPAANLVIELENDLPANSSIKVELSNAVWFFRSTQSGDTFADEYYDNGIETLLPTNYDTSNGKFVPTSSSDKGGVYTRFVLSGEVPYELVIGGVSSGSATLVTKNDASKGDEIVIPLVTRLIEYGDAKVSIESSSEISGTQQTFAYADSYSSNAEKPYVPKTKTYVNTVTTGRNVFPLDKIVIDEKTTGSISEGSFEIVAPAGVKFLPNVDSSLIKDNDVNAFNMKTKDGKNVVDIELGNNSKWTKGTKGKGFGENGEDYTITYHYPSGKVDYQRLIVTLKGIEKSKRDELTSLTITGIKLEVDDNVKAGDIELKIKNYSGKIVEEEPFVAAKKSQLASDPNSTKINNTDIEHYNLSTLITLEEFKMKPYIFVENNMVEPEKNVTRADVCKMVYELLADKDKSYTSNFYDVDAISLSAVSFANTKGFVKGYGNGEFSPNNEITRGEMAVIIMNIFKYAYVYTEDENAETNHWAYPSISTLVNNGTMSGYPDGSLKPDQLVTKAEAVSMINRAFERGTDYRTYLSSNDPIYSDLSTDHWAYSYLMNAIFGK